jgi:predicted ribonuclease YlaK
MTTIVLDTNIIISEPTILAKKMAGIVLATPFPVLTELAFISFTRNDVVEDNGTLFLTLHNS